MPLRWADALRHAQALAIDCCAGTARLVTAGELPWWALPVYVIAHQRQAPVVQVTAADLRYRCTDRDALLDWLYAGLSGMGHAVSPPAHTRTDLSEARAALDWLPHAAAVRAVTGAPLTDRDRQQLPEPGTRPDDDPVVGCWTWGSTMVSTPVDSCDGLTYPGTPSCGLWQQLPTTIAIIDAYLITLRGGWTEGSRVKVTGPPNTPLGSANPGTFGNRARVLGPVWALDHDTATLHDGPPIGYRLAYRSRTLDGFDSYPTEPVAADRLSVDLDPLHQDPIDEAAAARPVPATHTPPATDTSAAPGRPSAAPTTPRPRSIPVAADAGERYRAGALRQLWALRDEELIHVGDSTPRRIAERIAEGSYPAPPDPPTDLLLSHRPALPDQAPPAAAPPAPRPHQVTGERRRYLLQWLPEVTDEERASARQRQHLDRLGPQPALHELRQFLADEGFVQIADIHGNAGPPPTPRQHHRPASEPPTSESDQPVHLLMCQPADAQLAVLVTRPTSTGTRSGLRILYCVEPLDTPLFEAGTGNCTLNPVFDKPVPPHLWHGKIGVDQASVRVRLTVLRAFSRPVVPWPHPVAPRMLGLSSNNSRHAGVIAALPSWVRDLFPLGG
ncbi:hypothetical protein AB0M46_21460 [Dactylosporangium sp. NPDC051485]|uniref:hypothetical protein n=1 Tax=Dactylosporangium sp. NPDC051485 TaxID=3154846 RepID=UPI0034433D7B